MVVLRDETEDGRRAVRARSVGGVLETMWVGRLYVDTLAAVMGVS